MENVEIWLVRHGQTEFNLIGRLSGWSDILLTDLGREQARALRPLLEGREYHGVWSSDLPRAIETARLAWGEPTPDWRLREIDFGDFEGVPFVDMPQDAQKALLDYEGFRAPGGESLDDLENRVEAFLNALPKGRHLIFTHGGVVRGMLCGSGPQRYAANGSVAVMDWTHRRLIALHDNPVAPKPAPAPAPAD